MNKKEYILRDDPGAANFKVFRMRATVARSIPIEETKPVYAK